jgi:endo-1,4-beta-xylanase
MVSFATFAVAVAGVASVAVLAIDLPHPLEKRQGAIAVQNWGNENAVYKFTSGSAGKFNVDWNNPPGGNFVAGKGYKAQNM